MSSEYAHIAAYLDHMRDAAEYVNEWSSACYASRLANEEIARLTNPMVVHKDYLAKVAHEAYRSLVSSVADDALAEAQRVALSSTALAKELNRTTYDAAASCLADKSIYRLVSEASQLDSRKLLGHDWIIDDIVQKFRIELQDPTTSLLDAKLFTSEAQLSLSAAKLAVFESNLTSFATAADALGPLQQVTMSLRDAYGCVAHLDKIGEQIAHSLSSDLSQVLARDFQSFAALTATAMQGVYADDDEEDSSNSSAAALDNQESRSELTEVFSIAIGFILPAYKLEDRLVNLAWRIDPVGVSGSISWDRMILIIAQRVPQIAQQLIDLACPLLKRLAWFSAPQGTCATGTRETLSIEDAEEFDELAEAMSRLLLAAEQALQ